MGITDVLLTDTELIEVEQKSKIRSVRGERYEREKPTESRRESQAELHA
jgi:hypothetical protein